MPFPDALALARAAWVALLLLAGGAAAFLALVPLPAAVLPALRRGTAVLALAAAAAGAIHAAGAGPAQPDPATGPGLAVAATGLVLVAAAALLALGPPWLLAGALLVAASRALAGHAATREPASVLAVMMTLHAACAAWWAGSLWPLHHVLGRSPPAAAAPAVERFSALAMAAVATLAFAGIIMALVHLASPGALVTTAYGRLLALKLGAFAVLLALAARHRLALVPGLAAGEAAAAGRLRAGIRLEAVLMALVLLAATLLTATPPEAPVAG